MLDPGLQPRRARMLGRELDERAVRRLRPRLVAGTQQRIAEVQVGQRAAAVHLDGLAVPARGLGRLVALVVDEAQVVGGQRELRLQLERLGEGSLGLVVAALLVELQAAVIGALRRDARADRRGGGAGRDRRVRAVQALERDLHRGRARRGRSRRGARRRGGLGDRLQLRIAGLIGLLGQRAGLGVELVAVAAERLLLRGRQLEDELAALAAGQAAEGRRLVRDRRYRRRDISGQLGRGDQAVAIEIGLAGQRLQQRPGEDRMATGAVVGHLLVGAAGRHHLAAQPARVVAHEVGAAAGRATARQAQARVAGIDDEKRMLGGQRLAELLQLRHRDGVGLQVVGAGVDRDDVADVAPAGQLARAAMAGEEDEHAVIALEPAIPALARHRVERAQDVGARGVAIGQRGDVLGPEAELRAQRFLDGLGVAHRMLQARPALVLVDADHQRDAVAVEVGARQVRRGLHRGRVDGDDPAVLPGRELVALGLELVQHQRQRLDGAGVDVVEEHDAALLLAELAQHARGDRFRDRIGPVQRVDVPHHRAQLERLDRAQRRVVARAVGEAEQRLAVAAGGVEQRLGRARLLADLVELELGHHAVAEAVVRDRVAGGEHPLGDLAARPRLDLAAGVDAAQVAAQLEEHGRRLVALEDLQDLVGVARVRTVVEGQQHGLGRQLAAEELALLLAGAARGGRRRRGRGPCRRLGDDARARLQVGQDGRVVLQDALARVERLELGDVVGPLLALGHDAALREAAEGVAQFLLVGVLDLGQHAQVLAGALGQLQAGDALRGRELLRELRQELLEREPVGVEPRRLLLDPVQQLRQRGQAGRIGAASRRLAERADALLHVVEQHQADGAHRLALGGLERGLAVHQHDHLAMTREQLVALAQQRGADRRIGGRRLQRGQRLGRVAGRLAAARQGHRGGARRGREGAHPDGALALTSLLHAFPRSFTRGGSCRLVGAALAPAGGRASGGGAGPERGLL